MRDLKYCSLTDLLLLAEGEAIRRADGHLTLLRFTGHWKVCYGTPNLDIGGRGAVFDLHGSDTLREALIHLLERA
jgi:hypothetical protein